MARNESLLRLRQMLVKRRDALRKALAGDLSELTDLERDSSGDLVDFALDTARDELSSQLADIESRELSQIEVALQRMSAGTYGRCELCAKPITMPRLQALPYAATCIACQRQSEEAGYRDRSRLSFGRVGDESGEAELTIDDVELDVS